MINCIIYLKELAKTRFKLGKYISDVRELKASAWFDVNFYKTHYRDVKETGINPCFHYIFFGQYESRVASADYYQDFMRQKKYRFTSGNRRKAKAEARRFSIKPYFTVLLYIATEANEKEINSTILSINSQTYQHFELLVGVEAEGSLAHTSNGQNIRTYKNGADLQTGYAGAKGDYVAVVACGDRLSSDALFEVAKAINTSALSLGLIYADEDSLTKQNKPINPHYKTDYNEQLLRAYPYMGRFIVFSTAVLQNIAKPFDPNMGKAAVYDACLKVSEKTNNIAHIEKVLCHGSAQEDGAQKPYQLIAQKDKAFLQAVKNHIKRTGQVAQVAGGEISGTYKIEYAVTDQPLVSIIIPFKDSPAVLKTCVNSILSRTQYQNFEIVLVSNNSEAQETFALLEKLKKADKRIVLSEYNKPFNFSAINNYATKAVAKGEYLLFLNNDTEVISKDWLGTMLGVAQQKQTGAVTAKLLYPNNTVQSAGIGISQTGEIVEYHKFFKAEHDGYFGRLKLAQDIGAVSGACLMVARQKFNQAGGFDEAGFPVTYNDIDLCYRLKQKGYTSMLVPYVSLYHYESMTRDQVIDRAASKEYQSLISKYGTAIRRGDPYYNINFKQKGEKFEME